MIFTIGYAKYEFVDFIKELYKNKINVIVDVRSSPYSKMYPMYNREILKRNIPKDIIYLYLGKELGARREELSLYTNGQVDFDKVQKNKNFIMGINRIINGNTKGYNIVLLCAENNPLECHRGILISRYLTSQGIKVTHIIKDKKNIYHKDLIDSVLPNCSQISLFDKVKPTTLEDDYYKERNLKIGYKIDN